MKAANEQSVNVSLLRIDWHRCKNDPLITKGQFHRTPPPPPLFLLYGTERYIITHQRLHDPWWNIESGTKWAFNHLLASDRLHQTCHGRLWRVMNPPCFYMYADVMWILLQRISGDVYTLPLIIVLFSPFNKALPWWRYCITPQSSVQQYGRNIHHSRGKLTDWKLSLRGRCLGDLQAFNLSVTVLLFSI